MKMNLFQQSLKENRRINRLTLEAHEYAWNKNLKRNSKLTIFKTAKTLQHIAKLVGKGKEILITGVGYSLEASLEEIREKQQKGALIFATDASTKYLYDNGIYPEFIFQLDSKKMGMRFFNGLESDLHRSNIVISSAVDKEFVDLLPSFKDVFSYHMYDPSLDSWGGNENKPKVVGDVGVLIKGQDYSAQVLLPNIQYVTNRGNVFNLILQVAQIVYPKKVFGYGTEHVYQTVNGNVYTRAMVRDDTDTLDYSIGGDRIPYKKLTVVFRQTDNKLFYSEPAFLNYAKNANQLIKELSIPYIDRSDGLVLTTYKEIEDEKS